MTNLDQKDLLLEIKNLQVSFKTGKNKIIKIVRGVDLKIKRKQIIGLVGESGSGKSVTSKSLLNINEFDITEVDVMKLYSKKDFNSNDIEEVDLKKLKKNEWINIRGKKIGYIPQDPLTSLNPTRTIKKQLLDVLKNDPRFKNKEEKVEYLIGLLEKLFFLNFYGKCTSFT